MRFVQNARKFRAWVYDPLSYIYFISRQLLLPNQTLPPLTRGGHLRYWARYFGISAIPQAVFFTATQNTAQFWKKYKNTQPRCHPAAEISQYRSCFSMMSLMRQHSKKGNFVSSNAGVSGRDFVYSKH